MKRSGSVAILVALLTGVVPSVRGAGQRGPAREENAPAAASIDSRAPVMMSSVIGSVMRLDRTSHPSTLMVTTEHGQIWIMELPPELSVAWNSGQPVSLDGLKAGERVEVFYSKPKGRKRRARLIRILSSEPAPPSSPSPTAPGTGRKAKTATTPTSPTATPASLSGPAEDPSQRPATDVETEMPEAPEIPQAPELPDTPAMPATAPADSRHSSP